MKKDALWELATEWMKLAQRRASRVATMKEKVAATEASLSESQELVAAQRLQLEKDDVNAGLKLMATRRAVTKLQDELDASEAKLAEMKRQQVRNRTSVCVVFGLVSRLAWKLDCNPSGMGLCGCVVVCSV
jgi:hypothetical protein